MSNSEYHQHLRNLNDRECQIVMYIHSWCKSYVSSIQKGQSYKGFKIFLNGAGGTGKSHVIKLIR